jgi:enoyl-CoA hydratase
VEAPAITPVDELRELSRRPPTPAFSPLGGRPSVIVHAKRGALKGKDKAAVRQWLRAVPCPVIGIGGKGADPAVSEVCDVVAQHAAEATKLAQAAARFPLAASVLVQLLRVTETLPVDDAITAESLAYATLQGGAEHRRWLAAHRAPRAETDVGPAVVMTRKGKHLELELNRPSNRNAMSVEMRDALNEAFELVVSDASIKTVRLSGRGQCFSTGGDLAEFGTVPDPVIGHAVRSIALPGRLLALCAKRVEVRVHSACIGSGIELPAFAARMIAAKKSFFQLPELSMGLIPGAGGTVSIPRRIGRQRTAWLVLSGEMIDAKQAKEWGLVDAIKG